MLDASNLVHFVNPRMLLVECEGQISLRFSQVVMITRIVRHNGDGVTLLAGGSHFDASSAFELIQALMLTPAVRRYAFVGPETALRDLDRLLQ